MLDILDKVFQWIVLITFSLIFAFFFFWLLAFAVASTFGL